MSTDIAKTSTDFATLQSDVNASNVVQFKTDVKVYNSDSRTANLGAHNILKTVHSKTINTTLKSDASPLRSTENSCLFVAKQQSQVRDVQPDTDSCSEHDWQNDKAW